MADLGKITPTKPAWSRINETIYEDSTPHPQPHPEKNKDKKKGSDETPEQNKKPPEDPDDEHQIDLFV